ncbi:SIS domain-containing protein [Mytilinidion resinicola]|uniref:SIS domain-containing protein n=1 Tax=Mytilinidion resinicola TaxID=574789 RepID=A0A6A6Y2N9_9PEZI|nr:SIS domain-containing protein [Mytilinidion resinicola]KAF2802793.1 SIS domain-containing protein [Mytilinidion resinicola]
MAPTTRSSSPAGSCTLKRKRSTSLPLTPPLSLDDSGSDNDSTRSLARAVGVLSTAATALSHATRLYQTLPSARDGLLRAVDCITRVHAAGGRLIVCGVGKSGLVGRKTVATMKSLGLGASFLHAGEAMHGDLGDVRENDALLFITFSGRTPELLSLLPHLPKNIPLLALTAHTSIEDCPLLASRPDSILLPAPIHEPEEVSFGVCAPTTSTTVAIAIGDMLAITAADAVHRERARDVFRRNHPGGAIGARVEEVVAAKEVEIIVESESDDDVQFRKRQREISTSTTVETGEHLCR